MALRKQSSGKLIRHVAADPSEPFSAGDWSDPEGDSSISVNGSGELVLVPGGTKRPIEYTPLASRGEAVVVIKYVKPGSSEQHVGAIARGFVSDPEAHSTATVQRSTEIFQSREDGVGADNTTVPAKSAETEYWQLAHHDGTKIWGYEWLNDVLAELALVNTGNGKVGIWLNSGSDGARILEFYVHETHTITVHDVPSGGKAQVRDAGGTLLAEATESSGVATISDRSVLRDAETVQTRDSGGNLVDEQTPSEGVWGGDVYEEDIPRPDTPTVSVDARDETTADLSGSTFSDPQGDAHAASQWQVDTSGGDFSSPAYDSGETATDLLAHTATGLSAGTSYKARVRYKDDAGDWSLWSEAVAFETLRSGWAQIDFDGAGVHEWTNPNATAVTVELLMQAAGGGGGSSDTEGAGGGGGAGGVVETSVEVQPGETIKIPVGQGGSPDQKGEDTGFWADPSTGLALDPDTDPEPAGLIAEGGGEGGRGASGGGETGGDGGSGGGAGTHAEAGPGLNGGTATSGQGNPGGGKESIGGSTSCQKGAAGGGGSLASAGSDGEIAADTLSEGGDGGGTTWHPKWVRTSGGGGDGAARQFDGKFNAGVCSSAGGEISTPGGSGSGPGAGGGGGAGGSGAKSGSDGFASLQFARGSNLQPAKPTISCDDERETAIDVTGSAFSDPDGDGHQSSQWQADVPEGDFSNPVHDSGEVTDDLVAHTVTGLVSERDYKFRVRYRDDSGFGSNEWSEWSDPVTCTTTGGSPCGDGSGHEDAATGDRQRMFLGEAGGGGLFLHAKVHEDVDGGTVVGEARTVPIAPAGVRGECHFARIVIVAETWTRGELTFTPIVDGEEITAEKQTLSFTGDGTEKHLHRWEIALSRTDSGGGFRYGMRGTWFQALLELKDLDGCGRVTITGVELDYDVVQERLSAPSFTGPTLELPSRQLRRRWFFGEDGGGGLLEGDEGNDDDGTSVEALAETNVVAPAGFSGECVFRAAYFTVRRANESALTLRFTPIVDDTELETVDVTLEALSGETVLEPRQVDFEQTYAGGSSTYLPRGASFRLRVETVGGLPSDRVELDGFELEYEVVSESLEASNA